MIYLFLSVKSPIFQTQDPQRYNPSHAWATWAIRNTPIPSPYTSWWIGFPSNRIIIIPNKLGSISP
jgi:hypothetical protein